MRNYTKPITKIHVLKIESVLIGITDESVNDPSDVLAPPSKPGLLIEDDNS